MNILIPSNPISLIIVFLMVIFALVWLYLFMQNYLKHRKDSKEIDSIQNFDILILGLRNNLYNLTTFDINNSNRKNNDIDLVFNDFCKENSLNSNSFIVKHVRRFFESLWRQLRFDLTNILEHSNKELSKNSDLLRNLSPSFLIFGLLGTLFGLSDTLLGLKITVDPNNIKLAIDNIQDLLKHLGNAFAPSFWGVLFTLMTLIISTFYNRYVFLPAKNKLYDFTYYKLSILASPLSTHGNLQTTQKENSIDKSKSKNTKIDDELLEKLSEQNRELTVKLAQISNLDGTGFSSFSDLFSVQKQINISILQIKQISEYLNENYIKYLDYRKETDKKNESIFEEAQVLIDNLKDRDREFTRSAVDPINQKLSDGFQQINEALKAGMLYVSDSIRGFDAPMKVASDALRNSLDNILLRNDDIVKQLENQFTNFDQRSIELKDIVNQLALHNGLQSEQINLFKEGLKLFFQEKYPIQSKIKLFFKKISDLFMKLKK